MRLLMTSGVSMHGHVIVQLQFFEIVVRYDKFLQAEPQHIPDCLVSYDFAYDNIFFLYKTWTDNLE